MKILILIVHVLCPFFDAGEQYYLGLGLSEPFLVFLHNCNQLNIVTAYVVRIVFLIRILAKAIGFHHYFVYPSPGQKL